MQSISCTQVSSAPARRDKTSDLTTGSNADSAPVVAPTRPYRTTTAASHIVWQYLPSIPVNRAKANVIAVLHDSGYPEAAVIVSVDFMGSLAQRNVPNVDRPTLFRGCFSFPVAGRLGRLVPPFV